MLTDADIEWMAGAGTQRRLTNGENLIREGQHTEWFVLQLEGQLLALAKRLGPFAKMGAGEIVGGMSLIESVLASVTVTAKGNGATLFPSQAV